MVMTDEVYPDVRFVRSWIGGPMADTIMMVRPSTRTITIIDRGEPIGRYVLCNIGWIWHQGKPS